MTKCSKKTCCTIQYGEDAGICMADNCKCHTTETSMTSHTPEEWEKEFEELAMTLAEPKNDDEAMAYFNSVKQFIRGTRLASFNEGVSKALEVLPESEHEEYDHKGQVWIGREFNKCRSEIKRAIQALITNQD